MNALRKLIASESGGGILMMLAGALALILANSPLQHAYGAFFGMEMQVRVHELNVQKPLLLWINDGLMAIFFFTVGLELKREVLGGELSSPRKIALPAFAALGGMVVPALVYSALNQGDAFAMRGWAIPTATDIAFALGVITLLGRNVPTTLKLFLVTLAIVDDIGAIIIIAMFYTADIAPLSLAIAGACCVALLALNRAGVRTAAPYLLVGLVMWLSVLKSGVHATLAGVLLAMFIPHQCEGEHSLLRSMEHGLHGTVSYAILPLFALANCGVGVIGMGSEVLLHPVPLGVALGLLIGKPMGVLLFSGIAIALGLARLPERSNALMFVGVACLTGIGFTMSLFIGSLAFDTGALGSGVDERLGILLGSFASALLGVVLLRAGIRRQGVPAAAGSAD
jgi:NhaA family Na+:H+ antiporter